MHGSNGREKSGTDRFHFLYYDTIFWFLVDLRGVCDQATMVVGTAMAWIASIVSRIYLTVVAIVRG